MTGTAGQNQAGTGAANGGNSSIAGTSGSASAGAGAGDTGGTDSGGTGGSDAGGTGDQAGSGNAGDGGGQSNPYFIGADITWVQAAEANGATYTDTDGTQKDILQLLKDHGFNYIRLRTFVDPRAADGYDQKDGFADLAHTIEFGKRIKDAGLGFLVDFHYSDNWADPGKQCVPVAWQGYTTIADLSTALHDYTKDAITQLIAGGARPDMVQIGNEITPGMLFNICDANGTPTGTRPKVSGSISNWTNLGSLLKAGVQGVKEVDSDISIMLHIDRCGDKGGYNGGSFAVSDSFISNAKKQGVAFDVFGESCYQTYQGDPNSTSNTITDWTKTLGGLATKYPDLKFIAAEYGPMEREINDVVFGLPNQQGIGTLNWEPDTSGAWNYDDVNKKAHALFSTNGTANTATPDLSLYDAMMTAYASRL